MTETPDTDFDAIIDAHAGASTDAEPRYAVADAAPRGVKNLPGDNPDAASRVAPYLQTRPTPEVTFRLDFAAPAGSETHDAIMAAFMETRPGTIHLADGVTFDTAILTAIAHPQPDTPDWRLSVEAVALARSSAEIQVASDIRRHGRGAVEVTGYTPPGRDDTDA